MGVSLNHKSTHLASIIDQNTFKMKSVLLLLLILLTTSTNGQEIFSVEVNSNNDGRRIGEMVNVNNTHLSSARFSIQAGTSTNAGIAEFTSFAPSYTATPGYGGYTSITSRQSGLILRAFDVNGNLRLMTGGSNITSHTRLFIDPLGSVGIGTTDPNSKVHLKDGDLYIDNSAGSAIILKSPNGTCYSVTVSNTGTLSAAATTGGCPN